MCGIAGIVSWDKRPADPEDLQRMCDAISHRGPDDEGYYFEPGVGLGMRRLSIIDLHTGHQPIHNEDGSIQIVFNGEIYNYKELRQDLQHRGHSFYTDTDTETIVHLYEEYGKACVEKLRGMFAFAIWDGRRRQLLLARDRLGVKPLFYAYLHGRLIFASELKAILQLPEIDITLNWKSAQRLFMFLATPRLESLVQGIHKLGPGQTLIATANQEPRVEQYWDIHFVPDYEHDENFFVERSRELLLEAVRLRMVSDVPVGAFLSGGLDSSSVVAMMSRLASEPVKTYTIGFEDTAYDETPYARQVATQFGTVHSEQILATDALDVIEDIAWYLDEPLGDSSVIPTYMVSKLAAKDVKVSLSADGGDELFAGYDKYVVENRERNHRFIPLPLRNALGFIGRSLPASTRGKNFLQHLALDGVNRYLDASTFFKVEDQRLLFRPEIFELMSADPCRTEIQHLSKDNGNWLSSLQYLDLKSYLPLDILTKVDRMSMAHSLEARVPLLDHKLVEFAATIPPELQLKQGTTKYIFKRAMRGILPDTIIDRRKHGFAVPLGQWFKGRFDNFLHDLLLSETSKRRGILNSSHVEHLIRLHRAGRPLDSQLWTLISFELWCRTFMDRKATPRRAVAAAHDRRRSLLSTSQAVIDRPYSRT
jgi:asparagine synthase (glutamine-hydrolysing)